ncbi:MAG: hypothetical protein U0798_04285 [Gemmataceae bacterium]
MAESIDTLILTALTRAAAAPDGTPLYASKTAPGLFPNSSAGKTAAKRAIDEALLSVELVGRPSREIANIRPLGLDRLIADANPKPVLDDFVRVLESRETQVSAMIMATREMTEQLAAMKRIVSAILPKVTASRLPDPTPRSANQADRLSKEANPPVPNAKLAEMILQRIEQWSLTASEDCPLPVLYRDVRETVSIGAFHDCLRTLHAQGQIYLHPWTGPLYALPEPTLSLLVGHEVAYYASRQNHGASLPSSATSSASHAGAWSRVGN